MTARLTKDAVLAMHAMLSAQTGGDDGLREAALLESALGAAYQTFGGAELYPTPEEKAARLGYSLIANHAFADGNKRMGMLAMLTLLALAGASIAPKTGEVARVGLAVADGRMRYDELLAWICENRQNEN
jgi:death-on-curing protein